MGVELNGYVDGVVGRVERLFDGCVDPNDVMCEALNALPLTLGDDEYVVVCQLVERRVKEIGFR